MSNGVLALHSIPEFHEQGIRFKPPAFVKKIQNVLTGRIFSNWKENLLTLGTVYCIINAALSFFTGYWFAAFCQFSLGCFLSIVRKDFRDFTDLHLMNRSLQKENHDYRLANARHTALLSQFEEKLQFMDGQNTRFTRNNATYETHLNTMGTQMTAIADELKHAREQGRAVSQEVIDRAIIQFDGEKEALKLLRGTIVTANEGHRAQVKKMMTQAHTMNAGLLEKMGAATRKLEAIDKSLATKQQEVERLNREVTRLEAVRTGLEDANNRLGDTITLNHQSAMKVSDAADKMNWLFKLKNSDLQNIGGFLATVGTIWIIARIAKAAWPRVAVAA